LYLAQSPVESAIKADRREPVEGRREHAEAWFSSLRVAPSLRAQERDFEIAAGRSLQSPPSQVDQSGTRPLGGCYVTHDHFAYVTTIPF